MITSIKKRAPFIFYINYVGINQSQHLFPLILIMKSLSSDTVIKLNIGGVPYYTYFDTLKRSSYFINLLNGEMEQKTLVNGDEIFIDRSGQLFGHILEFLRTGSLGSVEDDIKMLCKIREEAEYYQLNELIETIDGKK